MSPQALFFVLWAVLSGIHWITPGVTRFVAIGAGVIVAGGFFAVGDFWRRRAPASWRLRAAGWASLALAGGAIFAVTVILVLASAPRAVRRPSITGVARVGSLLTARPGRWTSHSVSDGFDYQWQDCRTACSDIADATGQTYRARPHDVARRIGVCVRATRVTLGGLWSVSSRPALIRSRRGRSSPRNNLTEGRPRILIQLPS
jgi:hypothetical protein